MDTKLLQLKFALLGARVKVEPQARLSRPDAQFTLDVRSDKNGEYFDIRVVEGVTADINVVDVRPRLRHLLLMASGGKFLCGHDERHWFAAAVPGRFASTVITAMEALKPRVVRSEEIKKRVRTKDRFRRRNAAFLRQGEWFFVPAPYLVVSGFLVLRNEPLSRGAGSKPHMCEYIYRTGGMNVYVSSERPNGITEAQYHKLLAARPHAGSWGWRVMRRNMVVYAQGKVSHPDHKTIYLNGWHRVFMNRENESEASRNLVFLD
jgi:hypothetical protein